MACHIAAYKSLQNPVGFIMMCFFYLFPFPFHFSKQRVLRFTYSGSGTNYMFFSILTCRRECWRLPGLRDFAISKNNAVYLNAWMFQELGILSRMWVESSKGWLSNNNQDLMFSANEILWCFLVLFHGFITRSHEHGAIQWRLALPPSYDLN
jgi:hypothetical protein